jgi:hypothetical protein
MSLEHPLLTQVQRNVPWRLSLQPTPVDRPGLTLAEQIESAGGRLAELHYQHVEAAWRSQTSSSTSPSKPWLFDIHSVRASRHLLDAEISLHSCLPEFLPSSCVPPPQGRTHRTTSYSKERLRFMTLLMHNPGSCMQDLSLFLVRMRFAWIQMWRVQHLA